MRRTIGASPAATAAAAPAAADSFQWVLQLAVLNPSCNYQSTVDHFFPPLQVAYSVRIWSALASVTVALFQHHVERHKLLLRCGSVVCKLPPCTAVLLRAACQILSTPGRGALLLI